MKKLSICLVLVFAAFLAILPAIAAAPGRQQIAEAAPGRIHTLQVNFVLSEPCSLVAFMDILAAKHSTSGWVKDWYLKTRKSASAASDQAMIDLYKAVMDVDTNHAEFYDETGRKLDLNQKILCLAADSKTLPELLTKVQTIVSEKQYQDLKKVLEYFAPVYHEMVWQPRLPGLQKQLEEHRQESVRREMVEMLCQVQAFMKAPWVPGVPFTIVLVPLPINGKGKHGQSFGTVQVVEVRPADTFEKSADVVFHEACHALWFSKKDIDQANSKFATASGEVLPLTELYESMATALAQGCFSEQAFGKTPRIWYRDKVIDDYSHKVVKLYAAYLNAGRSIDDQFCRSAAEIFFKEYPDANRTISLITEFLVLADQIPDIPKLEADIYKALPRIRGCSICLLDAPDTIKVFDEFERPNACALVTTGTLYKLSRVGVTAAQMDLVKNATTPVTLKVDKKQVLVCIAPTPADQIKLLFQCLKKSKWPLPVETSRP